MTEEERLLLNSIWDVAKTEMKKPLAWEPSTEANDDLVSLIRDYVDQLLEKEP